MPCLGMFSFKNLTHLMTKEHLRAGACQPCCRIDYVKRSQSHVLVAHELLIHQQEGTASKKLPAEGLIMFYKLQRASASL